MVTYALLCVVITESDDVSVREARSAFSAGRAAELLARNTEPLGCRPLSTDQRLFDKDSLEEGQGRARRFCSGKVVLVSTNGGELELASIEEPVASC